LQLLGEVGARSREYLLAAPCSKKLFEAVGATVA